MLLQRSKSHFMCIFEEDFIDCFNCLAVEFAPLAPQGKGGTVEWCVVLIEGKARLNRICDRINSVCKQLNQKSPKLGGYRGLNCVAQIVVSPPSPPKERGE